MARAADGAFGRFREVILIAAIVAGIGAWLAIQLQPPVFEARARILVGELEPNFDSIRAADLLATTYAEMATSETLVAAAIAQSGLEMDVDTLIEDIDARVVGTSRIVSIRVRQEDGQRAVDLANNLATALRDLGAGAAAPGTPSAVSIVDTARVAERLPSYGIVLVPIAALAGAAVTTVVIRALLSLGAGPDAPATRVTPAVERPATTV